MKIISNKLGIRKQRMMRYLKLLKFPLFVGFVLVGIRVILLSCDVALLPRFSDAGFNFVLLAITITIYTLLATSIFTQVNQKRVKVIQTILAYDESTSSYTDEKNAGIEGALKHRNEAVKAQKEFVQCASIKIHSIVHFFFGCISLIILGSVVFVNYKSTIDGFLTPFFVGFVLTLLRVVCEHLDSVTNGHCYGEIPLELLKGLKERNRRYNRIVSDTMRP